MNLKQMSKPARALYTVLFMLLVTVVFISVLAFTYLQTRDIIKRNDKLAFRRSVLTAAGLNVPKDGAEAEQEFLNRVRTNQGGKDPVYSVTGAQGKAGYVFRVEGAGLWGTIVAHVGLASGLDRILGVDFYKQSETPGLGARIEEPWFRNQFKGKSGPGFTMVPEGTRTDKPDQFDAVTGATVTSTAVRDMLNRLLRQAPARVRQAGTRSATNNQQ